MVTNLVQLFSKSTTLSPKTTGTVARQNFENPFGANPFANVRPAENSSYMKNTPVKGGYFAGYHNGVPNIVGQRLFIEA